MEMKATLNTLIDTARIKYRATASGGRWTAQKHVHQDHTAITITHHTTVMLVITDNTVTPISAGWGSHSDIRGINRILRGAGIPLTYRDIYGPYDPGQRTIELEPHTW